VSPVGVIASVGAVAFFRHYRAVVFGYLFFLVSIIFIVHFIPVGSTITADRFSYVAYIGLSVIAAAGCEFLLSHMPLKGRTAFAAAAGILVASVLTFASWERCRVWKDSVTLWTDVVGKEQQGAGDAYLGNEHLGAALVRTGRAEEGMSHLLKAVAADPTYAFDHDNLGNALSQLNRLDEAIREYRTALHLNPSYTHAHLDLANALRQLGRSDEAIAEYRATLAIDPGNAMANNNLAGMLHGLGRIDDAVALCRKAVALEPQSMEANFNLGIALMQVKRAVEADSFFRAAVAVAPSDLGTLNRLCQSFMKMGRTDLAVSAAGKAMALAKSTGQDDLAQAIAQNIEDMKRSGRGP
jgi:tetratricopeptide (TPR) repeat protein